MHECQHLWMTYLACYMFWGRTSLCQILFMLLFWGYRFYGIYNVPWMVQCTSRFHHVVPRNLYLLSYYGSPLLFLMGLVVYGCSKITHISVHSTTGLGVVLIDVEG